MVEFVSYNGKYPNLCSGTLVIKVDGKQYELRYILSSGGCLYENPEWGLATKKGPWSIDTWGLEDHPELMQYVDELTELVNKHIPQGCCGGCI